MSSNRKPKLFPSQSEMDIQSPCSRPCPPTITVRRNPIRKARPGPASAIKLSEPLSSTDPPPPSPPPENLKVFLRIRPFAVQNTGNTKRISDSKNVWPKIPKPKPTTRPKAVKNNEVCVQVNEDLRSVTVSTPLLLQETKRAKSEVAYEGFSRVFGSEASQADVYEQMVRPIVDDFLKGKSGMLTAMGPSGSGKTHTVFGSVREPGMVPLALRDILDKDSATKSSREYFLSMMEINSEQGKNEKLIDLLHDGGDVYMQQSVVKGIQEAVISDAQHAEALIAHGMLKRATATTNSNSQSSRSQCVINIRSASKSPDGESDDHLSSVLTIIDLAGAEKEKKTGNQGSRLLESNFINNTSMVFGLCLRSLLDHQKNRKKPLPKHYHNSLLTRYMRDYLEGKKRMTLILTVKPGMEDYPETSFLLKQASPFAEIKIKNDCSKRPIQALFPRADQLKRMKFTNNEASLIDEGDDCKSISAKDCKKISKKALKGCLNEKTQDDEDIRWTEIPVLSDKSTIFETEKDHAMSKVDKFRDYQILLGLSKAFWTLLKESKKEVEVLKTENQELKDTVNNEKSRRIELENELSGEKTRLLGLESELKTRLLGLETENQELKDTVDNEKSRRMELESELSGEKTRLLGLESELKELNVQCTHRKALNSTLPVQSHDATSSISNLQTVEPVEVTDVSSDASLFGRDDESCGNFLKIMGDDNLDKSESLSNESSFPTYIECETVSGSIDNEDPTDAKGKLSKHQSTETALLDNDCTSSAPQKNGDSIHVEEAQSVPVPNNDAASTIPNHQTVDPVEVKTEVLSCQLKELDQITNEKTTDISVTSASPAVSCSGSSRDDRNHHQVTDVSQDVSFSDRDDESCGKALKPMGDETLDDSESLSNESSFPTSIECDIVCDSTDDEDLTDAKGKLSKHQITETDDEDLTDAKGKLSKHQNTETDIFIQPEFGPVAALPDNDLTSSSAPWKNGDSIHVVEEQPIPIPNHDAASNIQNHQTVEPVEVNDLPDEVQDVKVRSKLAPKLSSGSKLQPSEKPKRRLLPASSVLLKDMSLLDDMDENDRPKVAKGRKTLAADDNNRTQGSLSLLRLLR